MEKIEGKTDSRSIEVFLTDYYPRYEQLTKIASSLIEAIIQSEKVDFLNILSRTKSPESIKKKQSTKKYNNLLEKFTDVTGIRIVTFLNSDVEKIQNLLGKAFTIDAENSLDRASALGTNKIGYRSVHFVCSLGESRSTAYEYRGLCSLKFEVQIRTVLQHAWAELAHDRSYKFDAALPLDLERQLNLYSGLLEIADRGFEELSKQIDSYTDTVKSATEADLELQGINSITLERFIKDLAATNGVSLMRTFSGSESLDAVKEIHDFGFDRMIELKNSADKNFISLFKEDLINSTGIGIVRTILMAVDPKKYFDKVQLKWSGLDETSYSCLLKRFNRKIIDKLLDTHDISVIPDSDDDHDFSDDDQESDYE